METKENNQASAVDRVEGSGEGLGLGQGIGLESQQHVEGGRQGRGCRQTSKQAVPSFLGEGGMTQGCS